MILSIRTDKPDAEIGLFNQKGKKLAYESWTAHRQLAETIHTKVGKLLRSQNSDFKDVTGLIIFAGPGSFTGLRIGFATVNALGYALEVPVAKAGGEKWTDQAMSKLSKLKTFEPIEPEYGAPAFTTTPKK